MKKFIIAFLLVLPVHLLCSAELTIEYRNGLSETKYYVDDTDKLSFTYGRGSNITRIIGLEQFRNLKELWLGMTSQLRDYNFLRCLSALEILVFQDISFSDVDFLSDMVSLRILVFQGCKINKKIDVSKNPNLEYFEFTNSSLIEFPVEIHEKRRIDIINVSYNKIKNIPSFDAQIIAVKNPIEKLDNENTIVDDSIGYFFLLPEKYRRFVR